MKVAILQSNYIPWKGYFDIINDVDLFIFYDDVQYTTRDWRNRNKIKTDRGTKWLTVPVGKSSNRLICDVAIDDRDWGIRHWKTLQQYYARAPFFELYRKTLENMYLHTKWSSLSNLNQSLIKCIAEILKIRTDFKDSRIFKAQGKKSERLIDILTKVNADVYLTGPSARSYLDEKLFRKANIEVIYKDYSGYPEYPQFYPPFVHEVTILDLLFHVGPEAPDYIWGWRSH